MTVSALVPWFGSNRMLGPKVGQALAGCKWVGIPFAGGMAELGHIEARTIIVCDKHKLVINLARVVADAKRRPDLVRRLRHKLLHPEELEHSQQVCRTLGDIDEDETSLVLAEHYFACCWMSRSGLAGTKGEFTGKVSTRWEAGGGDSAVRYYSAVRMLAEFARQARRCTFYCEDAFEFLAKCKDADDSCVYADPPFPLAGRQYLHNCGGSEAEEREWHIRLRDALARFGKTRVVARFYDHPLIRELYPEPEWEWRFLAGGRKQTNDEAPEVLIVRNGKPAPAAQLFDQ